MQDASPDLKVSDRSSRAGGYGGLDDVLELRQHFGLALRQVAEHRLVVDQLAEVTVQPTDHNCSRVLARLWASNTPLLAYRPQTNGKAERFIQTCLREWAYGRIWAHSNERTAWLPTFLAYADLTRLFTTSLPHPRLPKTTYCNSTATTFKEGLVVGMRSMLGNPDDVTLWLNPGAGGHT